MYKISYVAFTIGLVPNFNEFVSLQKQLMLLYTVKHLKLKFVHCIQVKKIIRVFLHTKYLACYNQTQG